MALELQNFEPDISGGYRRISGYTKWNSNIVPQTASSTEKVLDGGFDGNSKVIAARGTKYLKLVQVVVGQKLTQVEQVLDVIHSFVTISQEQILSSGQMVLTMLQSMTAQRLQTSMHLAHQLIQSL